MEEPVGPALYRETEFSHRRLADPADSGCHRLAQDGPQRNPAAPSALGCRSSAPAYGSPRGPPAPLPASRGHRSCCPVSDDRVTAGEEAAPFTELVPQRYLLREKHTESTCSLQLAELL